MKRIILFFVLIITSWTVFAGGGWVQEKNHGYFKLAQNAIIADNFFTLEKEIIPITTISLYTSSLYGEYGLSDRFTAIFYVPFFVRSTLNNVERNQTGKIEPGDELNSFGDTDLTLKYKILSNDKISVAASLLFGLPFGKTAEGFTAAGDPRILQTGDGEFNQLLMIEAGHSFYPKPAYITGGIGFNNRTNNFSDEIRWTLEFGYQFFNNLNAALKVYSVHSLKNGDSGGGAGNGVFGNNVEYISFGPELSYGISEHLGISTSVGFAAMGANLLAAPNWSLGIYLKK